MRSNLAGLRRRRASGAIRGVIALSVLIAGGDLVRAQNEPADMASNRVVHHFDFDERDAGNLEPIPMFWDMLRPEGFPHYAQGRFDFEVGYASPPSFHLGSEGRNVAYHYTGPDTRVRTNTDYRIEAAIRPDRLEYARACVSAHFLNKSGQPIEGTLVRSRFVGGAGDGVEWVRVDLYLPAAPPDAYAVGLIVWVMQEPVWSSSLPFRRHIPRNDVKGGAWFDDITIFALPRAEISTSSRCNILAAGEPQTLYAVLADSEDASLHGRLSIMTAAGELVEEYTVPVVMDSPAEPLAISVEHLAPGLYHARFDVFAARTHIVSRELVFARLASSVHTAKANARPFGIVIDPASRSAPDIEFALLKQQLARSAKLPVWTGTAEDPPTAKQRRETDRLLQDLVKEGFALTGMFVGPPSAIVRSDGAYVRPLTELLTGEAGLWREHLATVVAPYASAFRWWQMGADLGDPITVDANFVGAASNLRDAMRRYITLPRLVAAVSPAVAIPAERLPIEQVSVSVHGAIDADGLVNDVAEYKSQGYESVSAYIEPLAAGRYLRLPRLADWARRILIARYAGADAVFVPQTWHIRDTSLGPVTEPDETFLILRTIADVLGSAKPAGRLLLEDGVECLVFDDGGDSMVLALWDMAAPPDGRMHTIQLGAADTRIDLWGRKAPLAKADDGRHRLSLSPVPVLVPGVEKWLIDFRGALSIEPREVQSGSELVRHEVQMRYRGDRSVTGTIEIAVPDSWEPSPRHLAFSLMPQRVDKYPVELKYPHNEPAGRRYVVARTQIEGGYYLEVPLSIELRVEDLDIWGSGVVEGNDLVLAHTVTNRSSDVLSFRASAVVPGHERQYRPISNLRPGETQSVEYRFHDGKKLIGRSVRLVLREMNDGPRMHNLAVVIP